MSGEPDDTDLTERDIDHLTAEGTPVELAFDGTGPADREDLLDHLYKVLCDDVPSCGCGWPEEANRLVWEVLRLAPTYGADPKKRLAELIGPVGARQIVLATLDRAGLIDHGTAIDSLWLTARGRWVLWAVEQVGGIDGLGEHLEMAGFPHYDVPRDDPAYGAKCTEACWQVPDGWKPEGAPPEPEGTLLERATAAIDAERARLLARMTEEQREVWEATRRAMENMLLYGSPDGPAPDAKPGKLFDGILPALATGRWRFNQQTKSWEAHRG